MNVVIYARFSSAKQNETSIEAQVKECYSFCNERNYTIIGKYIDKAKSAKTDDRPNFLKMIKDSDNGQFEAIVVYTLDRFARNKYDSAIYKTKLRKNGVRVFSAKENIADGPSGILQESVLEGMAEYYVADLAQKVQRNMKLNAENGFFNGGYTPLGYKVVDVDMGTYKKRKLEIDIKTAGIVKEIFEMRANGTKIIDIINYLNNKGYKTGQGKKFTKNSLQQMLKNKRYIGISKYGNEEYENMLPKIIDKKLFNKVQNIRKENTRAPAKAKAKEEYILSGKLFCGNCKEKMIGICGTSKTGKTYYYYACNGRKKKKCKQQKLQKHYIEDIVTHICQKILTKSNIDKIAKEAHKLINKNNARNCLIKQLQAEEKNLLKAIENLLKAIESGENIDIINNRLIERKQELEEVRKHIAEEENKLTNITEEHIRFFLWQLKDGDINDIKYRKLLINTLVNKIYIYEDNKATIIFNISEDEITMDDIQLKEIEEDFKDNSLFLKNGGSPRWRYPNPDSFFC